MYSFIHLFIHAMSLVHLLIYSVIHLFLTHPFIFSSLFFRFSMLKYFSFNHSLSFVLSFFHSLHSCFDYDPPDVLSTLTLSVGLEMRSTIIKDTKAGAKLTSDLSSSTRSEKAELERDNLRLKEENSEPRPNLAHESSV